MRSLFHLAFHVTDLDAARRFYGGVLGCQEGRSTDTWVDFDFFGHQIVAHLSPSDAAGEGSTNPVDGEAVPVRHFGVILSLTDWNRLVSRLSAVSVAWLIAPQTRFAGTAGEQATCFVRDPSGNALEFKAFASEDQIFAR